jgi:hypothetical protein
MARVDLVFVDGAHDYETVKKDTETAFSLVSENGCILWDDVDVDWPDVVKALKHSKNKKLMRRIRGTKLIYYSAASEPKV